MSKNIPFGTHKAQRQLFWEHSGFPPMESPLPAGAKVEYRHHFATGIAPKIETGFVTVGEVNSAGFYTLLNPITKVQRHVHERDIRPALSEDDFTFVEERIAQWAYSPDRFAKYVAQIEKAIRED